MIVKCKFDKDRDFGLVFKGLAPDINALITDGKVSGTPQNIVYNQMSELEDIGVRFNDDFDLYKYYKSFNEAMNLQSNHGTGSSQPVAPVASSSTTASTTASTSSD